MWITTRNKRNINCSFWTLPSGSHNKDKGFYLNSYASHKYIYIQLFDYHSIERRYSTFDCYQYYWKQSLAFRQLTGQIQVILTHFDEEYCKLTKFELLAYMHYSKFWCDREMSTKHLEAALPNRSKSCFCPNNKSKSRRFCPTNK